MPKEKDPKLTRAGVSSYNKPKRTPDHPTKKFVVVAKEGDTTKLIRFGDADGGRRSSRRSLIDCGCTTTNCIRRT